MHTTYSLEKRKESNPSIFMQFLHQVQVYPDKTAIKSQIRNLTYSELYSESKALSQKLVVNHLVQNSDPAVAILLPNGQDFIVSVLALFQASKAYAPLSVDYPPVKLLEMLQQLGNPVVISDALTIAATGLKYEHVFLLNDVAETASLSNENNSTHQGLFEEGNQEIACVYFTSGSTGVPNGVLIDHSALHHCFDQMVDYWKVEPSDEFLCFLNPAFVLSTYEMWPALISGATIHVPPNHLRYDMSLLRAWVKDQGTISIICMVTSAGEQFFKAPASEFPASLRSLILGGEKPQTLPPSWIKFKIHRSYGSTESLGITATEFSHTTSSHLVDPIKHTLVGKCLPGVQCYILEVETQKVLLTGEIGEIAVGGCSISRGYLNSDSKSDPKYVTLDNGVYVVKMGDLGYFLPTGELVLLNRRDNLIKVGGHRFDLVDLECALLQHPSVNKVVAVLEKVAEQKFHLFYKLKDAHVVTDTQIYEFLQHRLPHYAFPHSLTNVNEFPRNAHGKVNKVALLQILKQKSQPKIVEAPASPTEKILIKIWSSVLQIPCEKICRTDNFFALGGNSSLVVKVIAILIDTSSDLKIEPFNIFRTPILKNLALFLDNKADCIPDRAIDFEKEVDRFSLDFSKIDTVPAFDYCVSSKAILVTGATGYLGCAIVMELLTSCGADIYCLIRSEDAAKARERFEFLTQSYGIQVSSRNCQRLRFISGDVSLPRLGLTETEYDALAGRIDQVYHCGAEVHWLKRYEDLCASNVQGTLEILKFVSANRMKFLHYVSTVGVLDSSGKFSEKLNSQIGYIQSKWIAEKLVSRGLEAGIPGIVYRPGIIGAHSELKIMNSHDFITLLFKACKELGAYPDHAWEFHYGSLDFTTKCITFLAKDLEGNVGKTYNTFQNIVSFDDFFDYFESISLERVSVTEWQKKLLISRSDSYQIRMCKLFVFTPYLKEGTFFEMIFTEFRIKAENTEALMALAGENQFELKSKLKQVEDFIGSVFGEQHDF